MPKCLTTGIISQVFPLHDPPILEKLQNTWVRDIWASQPLGLFIIIIIIIKYSITYS